MARTVVVTDRVMRRVWNSPWTMLAAFWLYAWLWSRPSPWWLSGINALVAVICGLEFFSRGKKRWGSS